MLKDPTLAELIEIKNINMQLTEQLKTFNRLRDILARCRCGVHLTINEHRNYYQTVEEYFEGREDFQGADEKKILEMMIQTDSVIHLQVYPDTPIGFYDFYHYELDVVIDRIANILTFGYPKKFNKEVASEPKQD